MASFSRRTGRKTCSYISRRSSAPASAICTRARRSASSWSAANRARPRRLISSKHKLAQVGAPRAPLPLYGRRQEFANLWKLDNGSLRSRQRREFGTAGVEEEDAARRHVSRDE